MHIQEYIIDKKQVIDRALDRYLPSSGTKPQVIHRAMRYAVFSGGKRIRPILAIAGFETCGGRGRSILPIACAIELVHSYTLIHDDLPCMDDDDFRRGKPTCHKKFGEAIALLAGDGLLTLAFQVLLEAGDLKIVKEVSRAIGSRGTIGGQVIDISKIKKSQLNYIVSHKTGKLFEVAVKAGGMFSNASKVEIDALSKFGSTLGFMFQLVDDLLDRDGYVKAYGVKYVKNRIEFLNDQAQSQLRIFGKKAHRLVEIADLIAGLSRSANGTMSRSRNGR